MSWDTSTQNWSTWFRHKVLWKYIRFYTVQNHSATEIHEKLCAVYDGLMHCGPYTEHNFSCISFALQLHTVLNRIMLQTSTALYIWIACSMFAYWYLTTYCTVRLEIFTVYPATQNLVLQLIWFHSVPSWLRTSLGNFTFGSTLIYGIHDRAQNAMASLFTEWGQPVSPATLLATA